MLRSIPKKSVKIKEKEEEKMLNESEVFKTDKKHDLDVVPVSVEKEEKNIEKEEKEEVEIPKKKKKVFPKFDCECGVNVSTNMIHIHKKQKIHMAWEKAQKEKNTPQQNVETEKVEISVPQKSEEKKQETVKQINQPFQIDYDRIINGVSQNYINYKIQKQEHKKKQPQPVDNYKQKYEELLLQQEKDKKKSQANMYLLHQNQTFGRRRNQSWFN